MCFGKDLRQDLQGRLLYAVGKKSVFATVTREAELRQAEDRRLGLTRSIHRRDQVLSVGFPSQWCLIDTCGSEAQFGHIDQYSVSATLIVGR